MKIHHLRKDIICLFVLGLGKSTTASTFSFNCAMLAAVI
jgi:hypothetical protein